MGQHIVPYKGTVMEWVEFWLPYLDTFGILAFKDR
jgi:hypothetical protein